MSIKTDKDGGQYGVCTLENEQQCEEWALMRGECGPAMGVISNPYAYCAAVGNRDIVPAGANKIIFTMAPILAFVPAMIGFAVVPFGAGEKPWIISDINVGILYILAVTSIGAYGIILGGWASNNKYSLLGGLRAAAQVISYELNIGLAIVGVLLLSGSLSLVKITEAQAGPYGMGHWYIWPQFVAFVIYSISAVAETNRLPFDLPEAESELVAGFFTEYSGMRFSFFFSKRSPGVRLRWGRSTRLWSGSKRRGLPRRGWETPRRARADAANGSTRSPIQA